MFHHELQEILHSSINIARQIFDWFFDKEVYQIVPKSIVEFGWSIVQPVEVVNNRSNEGIFLIILVKFFLFTVFFKAIIISSQHKMKVVDLVLQFFANQW